MICNKCGFENTNESLFCSKCGNKLEEEHNETIIIANEEAQEKLQIDIVNEDNINKNKNSNITKLNGILKNKKVLIPVLIICCLAIISGITYLSVKPPSTNEVFNKIKDYKTEDAVNYLNEVYPENGGFLGMFKEQNKEAKVAVLELMINNLTNKFQSEYGRSISDYNAVKISKVDIGYRDYSSDYVDIKVTVTNSGKTAVNYIKINLYFKDNDGKIIKSDWTNDNSVIQPGASQEIIKMAEKGGWEKVSAEIAEIR